MSCNFEGSEEKRKDLAGILKEVESLLRECLKSSKTLDGDLEKKREHFAGILKEVENLLRECLRSGETLEGESAKKLQKFINALTKEWSNFREELINLLELLEKISDEEARKLISALREKLLVRDLNEWLKAIENAGYEIGKNASSELEKTFERNRFKILENARLENFDQVIYILERTFFGTNEQKVPLKLIELLADPSIASEIKKSAVYLFLAAFDKAVKDRANLTNSENQSEQNEQTTQNKKEGEK